VKHGTTYWLADGFHRVTAAIIACIPELSAEIINGTKRDAILYSVGCNANHGLRRTNADKRKAVMILLQDDEWKCWTDGAIAKQCCVDRSTVTKIRNSHVTFTSDNQELPNKQPQERTYINKHGQTATMNTSNIGKTKQQPADEPKYQPDVITAEVSYDDVRMSGERR